MEKIVPNTAAKENKAQELYILLVEDDLIVQKAHYAMLIRLGYKVDIAADGVKALEMYPNGYNIILLDCGLPDISGIDVCKCIRQIEQQQGLAPIPIVMISAFSKDDLAGECAVAGINELATKPIHPKDLQSIIQKYTSDD